MLRPIVVATALTAVNTAAQPQPTNAPLICIGQKQVVLEQVLDLDRVPASVTQTIEKLKAEGATKFSVWVAYDLCAGSDAGNVLGFLDTLTYRVVVEEYGEPE